MRGALQGEEGEGEGEEGVNEKGLFEQTFTFTQNKYSFFQKKKTERTVAKGKEEARERPARASIWTRTLRTAARRSAPYLT